MPANWSTERRGKTRYPIELVVRYQTLQHGGRGEPRIGMTLDFSSSGLLISAAETQIPIQGSTLRIVVEWPVPLGGETPLHFVARGKVVRTGPNIFALFFDRHEFHVRKGRAKI